MPLANPYVQRIPADVKPKTAGLSLDIPVGDTITPYTITAAAQAIRLSLKTTDTRERKARALKVSAFLETVWNALRRDELVPQSLANCVKLAEAMYRGWAESREARTDAIELDMLTREPISIKQNIPPDTEKPEVWAAMEEKVEGQLEALEAGELGEAEAKDLDTIIRKELLKLRGVMGTDPDTMQILRREFLRAMRDGYAQRKRTADGDFTPDPKAKRFPEAFTEDGQPKRPPRPASGVRLTELVDTWWEEEARAAGRSQATYESYKLTFKLLAAFLKHDDAHRVQPADIMAFRGHRIKAGVSPGTVRLNLAGLKAVFEWAKDNLKVPTNPARDVKALQVKAVKLRDKDFTDEEAVAVLRHANTATGEGRNSLAKYWVPWLCAYTGARVGEMMQLRPQDLRKDEALGCHILTIHPEAGTVKDKEVREVVLHAHLVERGFPEVVEACVDGHLFLPPTNNMRRTMKTATGMLTDFVREVVKDPNVAPNHGWRHSFKTRGRDAGISDSVLDAICGHTPQTEGGRYGRVPLSTQAKAMEIYPRYL